MKIYTIHYFIVGVIHDNTSKVQSRTHTMRSNVFKTLIVKKYYTTFKIKWEAILIL